MDNYTEINVTRTNRVDNDRLHKTGNARRRVYLAIVAVWT